MKIYIRAMSEYDRDIRRKLVDNSERLYEHLIKIMLYPDSEYVDGWKKEVRAFIHSVNKTKRNKKFPSYKFIFEALSVNLDILDNFKLDVLEEMESSGLVARDISDEYITEIATLYAKWLATMLSTAGRVSTSEVYDWIDKNILDKEQ